MPKPTAIEIETEIKTLKTMKPTVRQTSIFGDNHHKAIDAQVDVLQEQMDGDEVDDRYGNSKDNIRDAAQEAALWLIGESEYGKPSDSWKELVIK
jgi:hypothetical protein